MLAGEFGEDGMGVLIGITDQDLLLCLLHGDPHPPEGKMMTEGMGPALPPVSPPPSLRHRLNMSCV